MKITIVHRETGLPLRKYLRQHAVQPVNCRYALDPGEAPGVRYLMSEAGTPGFSSLTGDRGCRVTYWLSKREFEIRVRQPQAV